MRIEFFYEERRWGEKGNISWDRTAVREMTSLGEQNSQSIYLSLLEWLEQFEWISHFYSPWSVGQTEKKSVLLRWEKRKAVKHSKWKREQNRTWAWRGLSRLKVKCWVGWYRWAAWLMKDRIGKLRGHRRHSYCMNQFQIIIKKKGTEAFAFSSFPYFLFSSPFYVFRLALQ